MKRIALPRLLVLGILLLAGRASYAEPGAPLEIILMPAELTIPAREKLSLLLKIVNRSSEPVGFIVPNRQNDGLRPYYLEVLSPEGEILEVESRSFGGHNETSGPEFRVLEPGTSLLQKIEVNGWRGWSGNYYQLWQLHQPGTYQLRMRYHPDRASCNDLHVLFFGPTYLLDCDLELKRRVWMPDGFLLSNPVSVTVTALPLPRLSFGSRSSTIPLHAESAPPPPASCRL